jgi:hypothetical protein
VICRVQIGKLRSTRFVVLVSGGGGDLVAIHVDVGVGLRYRRNKDIGLFLAVRTLMNGALLL